MNIEPDRKLQPIQKRPSYFSVIVKILPVCLILAVGIAAGKYLKSREPEIKRKPPQKQVVSVETIPAVQGNFQGTVHVMGTVAPDREVSLKSRVSGEVVQVSENFVEGGIVQKGELMVCLDDADYRIEVFKAKSALNQALAALALEEGSQSVARAEMELIREAADHDLPVTDLALRKPQLAQAKAVVESARADLQKAKLNLARTKIYAPFNALITEKAVEFGMSVAAQATLCTLVDTDAFVVEAQVPPDRLEAFQADPESGSRAHVYSNFSSSIREGRVVRITGSMNENSRMAGVVIKISDPLGIQAKAADTPRVPMLLDDYVDVKIKAREFKNVIDIPRSLLRENNTVWVLKDGMLEVRKIQTIWVEDGHILVSSGIMPGDALIVSDLPAPVPGMALQNADQRSGDDKSGSGS